MIVGLDKKTAMALVTLAMVVLLTYLFKSYKIIVEVNKIRRSSHH